mmetsp:Transcript_18735/g.64515  ORF Transcript_18735/g.64515 Transcript_18735/m.64515 type:complete len:123 (-) Transcript_18735:275-643(-)
MPSSMPGFKKGGVAQCVVTMWEDGGDQDGRPFKALRLWTADDRASASGARQITTQECATRAKQYLFIRSLHAQNTWQEDVASCTVKAQDMKLVAPKLFLKGDDYRSWFDAAAAHANRRRRVE